MEPATHENNLNFLTNISNINVWVIARVTVLFGINSMSNAIEIAQGEAECLLSLANCRPV